MLRLKKVVPLKEVINITTNTLLLRRIQTQKEVLRRPREQQKLVNQNNLAIRILRLKKVPLKEIIKITTNTHTILDRDILRRHVNGIKNLRKRTEINASLPRLAIPLPSPIPVVGRTVVRGAPTSPMVRPTGVPYTQDRRVDSFTTIQPAVEKATSNVA